MEMNAAENSILPFDSIKNILEMKAGRKNPYTITYSEKILRTEIGYDTSTRALSHELNLQQERLRRLGELVFYNFFGVFADAAEAIPFCITEVSSATITYASDHSTEGLRCKILSEQNRNLLSDLNEGRPLLIHVRDNSASPHMDVDFGKIISYPIFNAERQIIAVLMFGTYEMTQPFDEITRIKINYCCQSVQEQYLEYSRQQTQLSETINAIPGGVVILDQEQKIVQANQYVLEYLGIGAHDLNKLKFKDENGCDLVRLGPYAADSFIIKTDESFVRCGIDSSRCLQLNAFPGYLLTLSLSRLSELKSTQAAKERSAMDRIICRSSQMKKLKTLAKKVAPHSTAVLIQGESGTGKELFARAIHEESGRSGPLLSVNCATCNKDLLESELFGYEEGAYTGRWQRRR
jgi:transcriptional regulator with PAS, ATPase and Fis domain